MKVTITEETGKFIRDFNKKTRAKIEQRLIVLETFGHMIRMPYSRYVQQGIFELRVVGKDNIRLIYTFKQDEAIVFHAFIKKTEQISAYEMSIIKHKHNCLHL